MCIGIVNNGLELRTLEVVGALAFKIGAILGVGYILGVYFVCLLQGHSWGALGVGHFHCRGQSL